MAAEKGSAISRLIEAEEYLGRRLTEAERAEEKHRLLEAISQISGFGSLTDEQKERALNFALGLKYDVIIESLKGHVLPAARGIDEEINLALETAKEIGIELTQEISKVAVEVAEKALASKESK